MGLVLRRNKNESIHLLDGDATLAVITFRGHGNIQIDAPPRVTVMRSELLGEPIEPKPVTKKLSEILLADSTLLVYGIKRGTAKCELVWIYTDNACHLDMTWNDNFNAWSCRPASGMYQQVMVFVPEDQDE